jgi:predicted dehydrogenase
MTPQKSRRQFLKAAGALGAVAGGAMALNSNVHAGENNLLKIGLIGCGGRGTGAATQALKADNNVKLWAMADAFEDRLRQSHTTLQNDRELAGKLDVSAERRFVGFEASRDVIASCDVVLLCTPPHFRPLHLRAAVEARKHVFAEKPVAVDAPGVRAVLASCETARQRGLSIVSGLCLRYDNGFRETVRRLHERPAGDIVALQANDLRGAGWVRPREAGWSDMTWHMRNWYHFTWLSGDFNVEQHVHYLDVGAWIMRNEYPVRAFGLGGRQVRTGPEHGHIYDHFSVVYEYADGVKMFSNCRQQLGCRNLINFEVLGRSGRSELSERRRGLTIQTDRETWLYEGRQNNMYQTEHDELFASIRNGRPINNGEYMAKSTLLAIMGRMAAYTGQAITWEQALNSREDLTPPRYAWDVALPVPAVARPGVTEFR